MKCKWLFLEWFDLVFEPQLGVHQVKPIELEGLTLVDCRTIKVIQLLTNLGLAPTV